MNWDNEKYSTNWMKNERDIWRMGKRTFSLNFVVMRGNFIQEVPSNFSQIERNLSISIMEKTQAPKI